ncbi:uncharacterized protein LOC132721964 [Ruditapes philippinarum]|uniref:uncharacterized protein LOC132721964 n=1 Tax=Ruditapes philippinarum TaxID=129788 RepID=UPI00295AA640|nr:uncharacterized protein LOC132721964 [Ruditapes philippinarum]
MSQPAFYVEADIMNKLYFNLKPSETTKASSALVAWCHNHNGDCQSDSEVQWKTFSWDTEPVIVQLELNENPQDFLYGVSAVSEERSSGLEWQECVYSKHKEPSREPGNVVIANGPMDNSLLVSWDKLNCKPGEPYIAIYNVLYMNLEDGLQKSQNTTALGEARLLLEDLVEDQTYVVQVRGVTKDGRYGPGSQPLSGIPLHYGFRSGTIIGLSLGIFAAVVTMVVACYCIIW